MFLEDLCVVNETTCDKCLNCMRHKSMRYRMNFDLCSSRMQVKSYVHVFRTRNAVKIENGKCMAGSEDKSIETFENKLSLNMNTITMDTSNARVNGNLKRLWHQLRQLFSHFENG